MFMRYALLLTSALCLMHAADDRGGGGVQLNDRTYWFGNTFPGGKGAEARWMMMGVDDLAVAGDRIFPLVGWEERGGEANIYSTAGEHLVTPEGWHSWGWRGGKAVATDQTYVYYSMGHNPNDGGGENFAGVARYTHDVKPAPFAGAQSGHRLAVNADHNHQPTGLAVGNGELFVADPLHQRIVVYATADLRQLREFPFVNPGRMVIDATPDKALWVIDTAANTVQRLSRDGQYLNVRISDCLMPVALAVTSEGDLLIADSDPSRQRIQRYRMPSGARVAGADFGSPIYQGPTPGVVTPGRFFRITGLACGADGSLYVSSWDYGGKLWRFDAQRSLVWVREGLEFVNCADADPADDTSIYSTGHRYAIDYAKPPGANWRHAAITLDPLKFPDDPRLRVDRGMAMRMLRISGKKVMFGKAQMDSTLFAWRFDGEIAVPAAIYSPHGLKSPDTESGWLAGHPEGPFIWMDSNGDGHQQAGEYVTCPAGSQAMRLDDHGNIVVNTGGWEAGIGAITIIPCTGVNAHGVPQWDVTASRTTLIPTAGGIKQVSKLNYDVANDRMYLGAWTDDHPFPGGGWEQMNTGAMLMRFDQWSQQPELVWKTSIIPPSGLIAGPNFPKAWSFETDYAFIAYTRQHERLAVDVYRLTDGKLVGSLLPGAEVGSTTGWIDMNDAVQSHRRADGTYVVFAEEVWMAKGLYWLWRP